MARKLAVNITMSGEDNMPAHFVAGTSESDLPAWAKERITNPDVWDKLDSEPDPKRRGEDGAEGQTAGEPVGPTPPPKSGAGSSADAWLEYASAQGVDVEQDAKRDDIIAACDAAGVPTE